MTALVAGGAGYSGSLMTLSLLEAGEKVVVIDNLWSGVRCAIPAAGNLVVGDIGGSALTAGLIRQHGVNAIIHFAGSIVGNDPVKHHSALSRARSIRGGRFWENC
ncbi:MAG: NAD-dependent epimerase/dehydratase family protein [Hyphomicrobiaceae bacterium]